MTKTENKARLMYQRGLIGIVELRALVENGKVSMKAFEVITGEPYEEGE